MCKSGFPRSADPGRGSDRIEQGGEMPVFINLPVADLARSRAFFSGLGFGFNDAFSDDKALAMVLDEGAMVMLLRREFFATFTPRAVADATATTEVLIAIARDDRAAVDALVAKALDLGGSAVRDPEDHGFMYGHAFADPDGHIWEPFWMDPAAAAGTGQ